MSPESFARDYARAERAPAKPCCGHPLAYAEVLQALPAPPLAITTYCCGACQHVWTEVEP